MEPIVLNIAKEFSDTPGPRHKAEGQYSGEEFLESLLLPRFAQATETGCKLLVDLDGSQGYPTSFLEEAFGGLARQHDPKLVIETIEFKSTEEPHLVEELRTYIMDARD